MITQPFSFAISAINSDPWNRMVISLLTDLAPQFLRKNILWEYGLQLGFLGDFGSSGPLSYEVPGKHLRKQVDELDDKLEEWEGSRDWSSNLGKFAVEVNIARLWSEKDSLCGEKGVLEEEMAVLKARVSDPKDQVSKLEASTLKH